jgi:RIO kinase 1
MGSRNPRKMVQQWAEKEYRNLRRMICRGIRCPIPIDLRGHVIAMSFLGTKNAMASPQLKDLTRLRPKLNSVSSFQYT